MSDDLQRQIDGLGPELRDTGQAPGRDLWSGIEVRIDQVERNHIPRRQPGGLRLWQVAAMAASVVLLVGVGYVGISDPDQGPVAIHDSAGGYAQAGAIPQASDLEVLDHTLRQLNDALRIDPDNHNLARLVLMVHKSRANVMRRQTCNWIR